ncbi:MAG: GNAT family N-acetyltransferase [Oscillospiraceae bacterium]|nr:GNAT family N-acetyltransferase [Oscillospiraceae bacterium]
MIVYREIPQAQLCRELFAHFQRRQEVTKCWRKAGGAWVIRDIAFVDDWSEQDYAALIHSLKRSAGTGGLVLGAFLDGRLKGFCCVGPGLFGSRGQYMDLSELNVSQELRRLGVGKELFCRAKAFAAAHGAQKLYLSAHSAVESQAFYRAMGCVEAEEYDRAHVEKEPCDCQLECPL